MPKNRITAVIVIYNKEIRDSITCKAIRDVDPSFDVLILDNSEISTNNEEYCKDKKIRYLSMDGNKGLSKAYNVAIDHCKDTDAIVFLDDDTEIKPEYFELLDKALTENPETDVFVPIIKGQDGVIYSPNEYGFLKNHFISDENQNVKQEAFNAIASCLAVRMRVFDEYRFNEKLFVDQVDQYFFYEQRKQNKTFGILKLVINQHFYQRGDELTPEAGWKRLRLRIYDIFRQARLMGAIKFVPLAFVKCCGLGVQIGKKSKSVKVIAKAMGLSIFLLFRDK